MRGIYCCGVKNIYWPTGYLEFSNSNGKGNNIYPMNPKVLLLPFAIIPSHEAPSRTYSYWQFVFRGLSAHYNNKSP